MKTTKKLQKNHENLVKNEINALSLQKKTTNKLQNWKYGYIYTLHPSEKRRAQPCTHTDQSQFGHRLYQDRLHCTQIQDKKWKNNRQRNIGKMRHLDPIVL